MDRAGPFQRQTGGVRAVSGALIRASPSSVEQISKNFSVGRMTSRGRLRCFCRLVRRPHGSSFSTTLQLHAVACRQLLFRDRPAEGDQRASTCAKRRSAYIEAFPSVSLARSRRPAFRASFPPLWLCSSSRRHLCMQQQLSKRRTAGSSGLEKHRRQKRQSKGAESLKPERESGRPAVRRAEPLRSLLAQHPRRPHTIRWDTIGRSRGGGPDGDGHGADKGRLRSRPRGVAFNTRPPAKGVRSFVRSKGGQEVASFAVKGLAPLPLFGLSVDKVVPLSHSQSSVLLLLSLSPPLAVGPCRFSRRQDLFGNELVQVRITSGPT